ncbi:MAG TPA: hypothetical protein VF796_31165, partial [Humisphaera sp.]
MTLSLLHRPNEVRRFLEACRTRRADVALIGDSNVFSAGDSGYALGWDAAWGRRFGHYATGVRSFRPGNANFTLVYGGGMDGGGPAAGSVPAALAALVPDAAFGSGPTHAEAGPVNPNFNVDFALKASHPNGIKGPLRWAFSYGTFDSGAGQLAPIARAVASLYYVGAATIPTNAGGVGTAVGALDLPADAGRTWDELWFALGSVFGDAGELRGPFLALWQRVVFADRWAGVGVTPMLAQGGQPTRAAAAALAGMTQGQFDEWARLVVGQQGGTPVLMAQVLQGQNDTADAAASVGPRPAPGNTPAGVVDNTVAVVERLRALWAGGGRDPDDLYVLVGPYHPQDESRRAWGRDLDDALRAYADGERNVAVASRSRVSTSAYVRHKGWYADGSDAHLSSAGYHGWAELAANAVAPAPAAVVRHATGAALDLRLFDAAGQVFDAARGSFGAWADADQADYAIAGHELGGSGVYRFDLPPGLRGPAGLRGVVTARA